MIDNHKQSDKLNI